MNQLNYDEKRADAKYAGFPPFSSFKNLYIDNKKWDRNIERLKSISSVSEECLKHAQQIVRRIAAIETGAIEKLYKVDRGFTWTVAVETTDIQALLSSKGENASALIKSQLEGYEFILDLATGKRQITEAWIRELHQVLCKSQKTYAVHTPQGPQERQLPLGEYKKFPNHVIKSDGNVHSYSPTDMVGAEMHRLLKEIKSEDFISSHPVIQAAYVHYGLVCIHPFSDGNGRVARALASIFLYRSISIPYLVMAEDRIEYLDTLEKADNGIYQELIDFTLERCFSAIDLIDLSIKAGKKKDIEESLNELGQAYQTKSGFSHEQVDKAASLLIEEFHKQVNQHIQPLRGKEMLENISIKVGAGNYNPISEEYRVFLGNTGGQIRINIRSKPPKRTSKGAIIQIHIPKDCDINDDFVLLNVANGERMTGRINEIFPHLKPSIKIKMEIFADSVISDLIERLVNSVKGVQN